MILLLSQYFNTWEIMLLNVIVSIWLWICWQKRNILYYISVSVMAMPWCIMDDALYLCDLTLWGFLKERKLVNHIVISLNASSAFDIRQISLIKLLCCRAWSAQRGRDVVAQHIIIQNCSLWYTLFMFILSIIYLLFLISFSTFCLNSS